MNSLLELMKLISSGINMLTTDPRNIHSHSQIMNAVNEAYSRGFILNPTFYDNGAKRILGVRGISNNEISGISHLQMTARGKSFLNISLGGSKT